MDIPHSLLFITMLFICHICSRRIAAMREKILKLLCNHVIKHFGLVFPSTDGKETEVYERFLKCNPLWGFRDMGCGQHFCKTPGVILF